jgi:ABC-type polysaccharide transport system permease subunit
VSAFFGVTGMTAIFAAATAPVMVGVLEAAKLPTAAWLARHWRVTPLLLSAPLAVMVLALMTVTAIGSYGFLTKAHLQRPLCRRPGVTPHRSRNGSR